MTRLGRALGAWGFLAIGLLGVPGLVGAASAPASRPAPTSAPADGRARRVVHVAAAESLRPALIALEPVYEATHDVDLEFRFGPSGSLRAEIIQRAPTDLFLSAGDGEIAALVIAGRVAAEGSHVIATNRLMLVTGFRGRLRGFTDLRESRIRQVAIGNPSVVPLGSFSLGALQKSGIWADVKSKIRYISSSAGVVGAVERNEVDAGIIYASDALENPRLKIVMGLDSWAPPIFYVGARVLDEEGRATPEDFLDYLGTDAARKILAAHGLGLP